MYVIPVHSRSDRTRLVASYLTLNARVSPDVTSHSIETGFSFNKLQVCKQKTCLASFDSYRTLLHTLLFETAPSSFGLFDSQLQIKNIIRSLYDSVWG